GDNMQNLNQLKAEIRAALQLAIATENEKLEEALLNYRTNLAKLEQEYLGQSRMGDETVRAEEVAPLSASSEQEGFETAGSDIAEKRNGIISFAKALPNTDMRPWQEEIRNLDELPDVGKAANLLYRRADDDSDDAWFEASLKSGDNSLYSLNDDMMDWLAEEYGIETGSNARTVLEALGYRVTVGVDRLIIQGNGLSFEIYKGTDPQFNLFTLEEYEKEHKVGDYKEK
ncbi:MAG: hypothetical protein IJP33_02480, partial [Firmicutes bacterium]|nr:hypothetical protein [Bacillota bacterium]